MENDIPTLAKKIPHLVRDWELECIVDGTSTIQKVPGPAGRKEVCEEWQRDSRLGRGGFSVVWLQRCISGPSKAQVRAVKEIETTVGGLAQSAAETQALSRELMAVIKFSHRKYREFFVQSFGWYYSQGSIFITMEYFPQGSLETHLDQPLSEIDARTISKQVLRGLAFMHRSKMAHRDIKPQNILVQQGRPNWWIKITDFGCSKQTESTLLRTTTGTPAYFAPELHPFLLEWEGEMSVAVDIWAVGAIAFRIVIGRLPFKLPPGPDLKRYVSGGPFPFPDQHSLSLECTDWIAAAMKPYPDQRPTAAEALASSWIGESSTVYGLEDSTATPAPPELPGPSVRPSLPVEEDSVLYSNQWDTVLTAPTMRLPDLSDFGRPNTTSQTPKPGTPVNIQGPKSLTPYELSMNQRIGVPGGGVSSVTLSKSGKWLAALLGDPSESESGCTVRVWHVNDQKECQQNEDVKKDAIAIAFLPDERLLTVTSHKSLPNGSISGKPLTIFDFNGHQWGPIRHPIIQSSSKSLPVTQNWKSAFVGISKLGRFVIEDAWLPGRNQAALCIHHGYEWMGGPRFQRICVDGAGPSHPAGEVCFPDPQSFVHFSFAPGGPRRLWTKERNGWSTYRFSSWDCLNRFALQEVSVAFSSNGQWHVVLGRPTAEKRHWLWAFERTGNGQWELRNCIKPIEQSSIPVGGKSPVAISMDSNILALAVSSTVEIYLLGQDGPQLTALLREHASRVLTLDFSVDSSILASGSATHIVTWEVVQFTP